MLGQTPMMKQYQELKKQYPEAILFFRLGDFYEMFGADALLASRELEITLTGRDAGLAERVPMCGIPHHAVDNYLAKLIKKGYKVAICEQTEDPKLSKGIVKREIIRVVTPGTVLDSQIMPENANHYLVALAPKQRKMGLAFCDVSTGEFCLSEFSEPGIEKRLIDELVRLQPSEILIPQEQEDKLNNLLTKLGNTLITPCPRESFCYSRAHQTLTNYFREKQGKSLICPDKKAAITAAGAIWQYLGETQKCIPTQIKKIEVYYPEKYLALDATTFRNLELTKTLKDNSPQNSLLNLLDKTKTACGARLLRQWLQNPLTDKRIIEERLDAVEILTQSWSIRQEIRALLGHVYDLERLMTRIIYGRANPQELLSMKTTLLVLPEFKKYLLQFKNSLFLTGLINKLDSLPDLVSLLNTALAENPSFNLKEGGVIKKGFCPAIDQLKETREKGREWLIALENCEKEKTGIKSLKIGYNKIFGYYFEVTKANLSLVPPYFLRKQTLANSERYITERLQELANQILEAEEKLIPLEEETYKKILTQLGNETERVQQTAQILAQIDVLQSLAEVAVQNSFIRPQLQEQKENYLHFKDLRHPVVEKVLPENTFVPNDLIMQEKENFHIITGPNMGGKSTYCRSIALAIIMAQMGSFVPAKEAVISLRDRVFARVGASDDLQGGQSTFMVEMNEVANILHYASPFSLVILDEVGRGTSTCDGLSMAWAISEYLITKIKCKTLFATHYHELTALGNHYSGINNLSVAVQEKEEQIIFLHKIITRATDKSYGIQVAELAGLPQVVIKRAQEILKNLEAEKENDFTPQITLADFTREKEVNNNILLNQEIVEQRDLYETIVHLDLLTMTPLEALNELFRLQNNLKNKSAEEKD